MSSFHTGGLDKIAAARLYLVSEQTQNLPYLAHALYALTPVASCEVDRVGVDESWRVYLDPGWLTEVDVPELAGQLLHVTWHLLHDHAGRARDLRVDRSTAPAWHTAADTALAGTLRTEGLLPTGLQTPAQRKLPEGRPAEEYFARLSGLPATSTEATGESQGSDEQHRGCGSGCDGLARGYELPPDADVGSVDCDEAQEIRRQVAVAYLGQVTGRGDQEGDAGRWAREILDPVITWEPLLAAAVRRAVAWGQGHTEYTYRRPSRRQSAVRRVVLPGTRRPLPSVAMVVDTSGSVDDVLLGRALGEVNGALKALGVADSRVTVLACDAAVHAVSRVRSAADVTLAGGGGTDMCAGIRAASGLRPRPELIVVLTDGYTPWPADPPPGSAVVAAMLGRRGDPVPAAPPWAQRVECLLD